MSAGMRCCVTSREFGLLTSFPGMSRWGPLLYLVLHDRGDACSCGRRRTFRAQVGEVLRPCRRLIRVKTPRRLVETPASWHSGLHQEELSLNVHTLVDDVGQWILRRNEIADETASVRNCCDLSKALPGPMSQTCGALLFLV